MAWYDEATELLLKELWTFLSLTVAFSEPMFSLPLAFKVAVAVTFPMFDVKTGSLPPVADMLPVSLLTASSKLHPSSSLTYCMSKSPKPAKSAVDELEDDPISWLLLLVRPVMVLLVKSKPSLNSKNDQDSKAGMLVDYSTNVLRGRMKQCLEDDVSLSSKSC